MREVDCRKLNCPEPVLRTRQALAEGSDDGIKVLVDNPAARENVSRFARARGYAVAWTENDGLYTVNITGTGSTSPAGVPVEEEASCAAEPRRDNLVFMFGSDQLGRGSEELGLLLMRNFIYTLTRRDRLPKTLLFINSGVRLCVGGSPAVEELSLLEQNGVTVLACGTCLDYFGLTAELAVGRITNMYDIADLLSSDTRVITL